MLTKTTVLRSEDLEWELIGGHRQGDVLFKRFPLPTGVAGYNMELSLSKVPDGFYSPRHMHNFDQFRWVIEGTIGIAPHALEPGQCGYFPEGVAYGPQEQHGEALLFLLQFPGPSGAYFLTYDELHATVNQIKSRAGSFDRGVLRSGEGGVARNKDGYEAAWEEHQGRPLTYPAPRYAEPIIMDPANFGWVSHPTQRGVETKHLGAFTEHANELSMLRLAPGARLERETLTEPRIRYLRTGSVTYEGSHYGEGSCFWMPADAPSTPLESAEGAEFLVIGLPALVAANNTAIAGR